MVCPTPLAPAVDACQGGTCTSDLLCACPSPWTGVGDFVLGAPSCTINTTAITALWSLLALAQCGCVLYTLFYLSRLYISPPKTSLKRKVVFGLCNCVTSACLIYCGAMRASSPTTSALGTNVGVTVAFAIASASFYWASLLFSYSFIFVLLRQARVKGEDFRERVQTMTQHLNVIFPIIAVLVLVAGAVLPLLMLTLDRVDANRMAMFGLAAGHYLGLGLTIGVMGLIVVPGLLQPIIGDLKESVANIHGNSEATVAIKLVLEKFAFFVKDLRQQSWVNLSFALFFGTWPWLQAQSSYLLPVTWACSVPLMITAMHSNLPVRASTQTHSTKNSGSAKSSAEVAAHVSMSHMSMSVDATHQSLAAGAVGKRPE